MQTEGGKGSPPLVFPNVQPQSLICRKSVRMILESDLAGYHTDRDRPNYTRTESRRLSPRLGWPLRKVYDGDLR